MDLSVIRHGQTAENLNGVIQGHQPGELTELGIQQAKNLGETIGDEQFVALYSSDLRRCMDTAEYIIQSMPEVPIYATSALREKDFGIYEGRPASEVNWALYQGGSNYKRKIPNGESVQDLVVRVSLFINWLVENHSEDELLVVTHGGPIRIMRSLIDKQPLSQLTSEAIPNCSRWKFTIENYVEIDEFAWD